MKYPTKLQFLEFFSVEPDVQEDVTTFKVSDESGVTLTLSFNTSDDSLQTSIQFAGRVVAYVCHEGMSRLWIEDGLLVAEFLHESVRMTAKIKCHPSIHVEWNGLLTNV